MEANMQTTPNITNYDISFRNSADGLWDIGISLVFLLAGAAFLLDLVAVAGGFIFAIFLLIIGIKKKYVYPRIGYVQHKGMSAKTQKLLVMIMGVGLIFLILGIIVFTRVSNPQHRAATDLIIQNWGAIVFGLVISTMIAMVAYVYKIKRLYLYSLLVFMAFLSMRFIDYDNIVPVSLIGCGAVMLPIGIVLFISFIRKYPRLDSFEEVSDDK
jgi:hypothetical protein